MKWRPLRLTGRGEQAVPKIIQGIIIKVMTGRLFLATMHQEQIAADRISYATSYNVMELVMTCWTNSSFKNLSGLDMMPKQQPCCAHDYPASLVRNCLSSESDNNRIMIKTSGSWNDLARNRGPQ